MLYTIENEKIRVAIAGYGAEFASIVLKEDGTEYLWQGDPKYWTGRAFNLFPICGRLIEGRYEYKGTSYDMKIHGFFRETEIPVIEKTATKVVFRLTDSEETRKQYPFAFEITVTYEVSGSSVRTIYAVRNPDAENDLIFTIGGHPGFRVPLLDGEKFEDYYLDFTDVKPAKQMVFSPTCFFTPDTLDFPLEGGTVLPLRHNLFDNDAIFLRDMGREVTLRSKTNDKFVKVTYPGMPYLGLWHAPRTDAPYICIEPWCSVPSDEGKVDDFETKRDMIHLAPGCTYQNDFNVEIG